MIIFLTLFTPFWEIRNSPFFHKNVSTFYCFHNLKLLMHNLCLIFSFIVSGLRNLSTMSRSYSETWPWGDVWSRHLPCLTYRRRSQTYRKTWIICSSWQRINSHLWRRSVVCKITVNILLGVFSMYSIW